MQTCLIVDESNVIRKVASRILFQMSFTVENAASGSEALGLIGGGEVPDIVIVAGMLPDMPSEEFVRALRMRPGGKDAVILASLVEANLGTMTRLKRAGATGFVFKPFDREAMVRWISPYSSVAA
ncbi:response regulator [Aureimonas sp. SA4125]|uniref:response regulator n=1 Tax=Aureimonas sp. SA4125 TaxID=2826993 RepID=UPI001CC82CF2|nr:response regulator [Aureimonas sp. SA4125]BDA83258.1 response regulator [Aureimonas sp. SA4125]